MFFAFFVGELLPGRTSHRYDGCNIRPSVLERNRWRWSECHVDEDTEEGSYDTIGKFLKKQVSPRVRGSWELWGIDEPSPAPCNATTDMRKQNDVAFRISNDVDYNGRHNVSLKFFAVWGRSNGRGGSLLAPLETAELYAQETAVDYIQW